MLETDRLLARLVGELRLLCPSEDSLIVSYNPVGLLSMFKPSNELEAGSKAADGIKMGASLGAARFIRNELLLYQGKDGVSDHRVVRPGRDPAYKIEMRDNRGEGEGRQGTRDVLPEVNKSNKQQYTQPPTWNLGKNNFNGDEKLNCRRGNPKHF